MNPFKEIDEMQMEAPVIQGDVLHDDFYKFAMGAFIVRYHPDIEVAFSFKNRTKGVLLADHVSEEDFHREFNHFRRNARARRTSIHYLRGTDEYGTRMFNEGFLNFLEHELNIPEAHFAHTNERQLDIGVRAKWQHVTYSEIPMLKIVNALYYRSLLRRMTRLEREAVYAAGLVRFAEKIALVKEYAKRNPDFVYSDFGNRRAFGTGWHAYLVRRQAEELPGIFLGPSATDLAANTDTMPVGTNAHELQMVLAALSFDGTKQSIEKATLGMLTHWWDMYGHGLSVCLPDTFGSSFMMETMTDGMIRDWKGFRQDSGDVRQFGEMQIERTKRAGADPRTKLLIPSDGLTFPLAFEYADYFRGRLRTSPGIGTNISNDMGLGTLSIVAKPTFANGIATVKLSDNVAKAICADPGTLVRYKKALSYAVVYDEQPVV